MNVPAFLIYVFVTSFTPGPNNIMAMNNARYVGFKKSMVFNLGVAAGFTLVMLVSTLFAGMLYSVIPKIKPYMLVLGGLYMLYLAYKTLRGGSNGEETEKPHSSFISGMLFQFINPKGIIYGITVASAYIIPNYTSPFAFLIFAVLLGIVALMSTTSWALFGTAFKKLFTSHAKFINIIMALLLVYCAIALFL